MATTPSTQRASQVVPPIAPPQRFSQSAPQAQTSSPQRASQSSPSRRSSTSKPPLQPSPRRVSSSQSSTVSQRVSQVGPPPNSGSGSGSSSRRTSKSSEPAPPQTPAQTDTSQNASSGLQAAPSIPPPDQVMVPTRRASQIIPPQPLPVTTPAPVLQPLSATNAQPFSLPFSQLAMVIESSLEGIQSKVEAEKEPERAGPFRDRPATKVMRRISLEMRHRMYLMGMRIQYGETGPVGCNFFVMGEIGKTFIVKIRQFPCCQCGDFLLQRLCKHMMFISLRVFRLEQSDHRIWQQALLPKELNALMGHPLITPPTKPAFRSKLRKPPPPDPPGPPKPETPICCPICFDEIQFFDNEVKKPLGAKRGPKPKLEMGTRRKKDDKVKVEEALAEPWAERIKKFEPLLHCPTRNCQVDGCMQIVHEMCYLKWNRFKKMSYDLPQVCLPNNFYPCAFTCH